MNIGESVASYANPSAFQAIAFASQVSTNRHATPDARKDALVRSWVITEPSMVLIITIYLPKSHLSSGSKSTTHSDQSS
jgi:hypothetical protein